MDPRRLVPADLTRDDLDLGCGDVGERRGVKTRSKVQFKRSEQKIKALDQRWKIQDQKVKVRPRVLFQSRGFAY